MHAAWKYSCVHQLKGLPKLIAILLQLSYYACEAVATPMTTIDCMGSSVCYCLTVLNSMPGSSHMMH